MSDGDRDSTLAIVPPRSDALVDLRKPLNGSASNNQDVNALQTEVMSAVRTAITSAMEKGRQGPAFPELDLNFSRDEPRNLPVPVLRAERERSLAGPPVAPVAPMPQPKPSSRLALVLSAGLIAATAGGAGAAAWMVYGRQPSEAAATPEREVPPPAVSPTPKFVAAPPTVSPAASVTMPAPVAADVPPAPAPEPIEKPADAVAQPAPVGQVAALEAPVAQPPKLTEPAFGTIAKTATADTAPAADPTLAQPAEPDDPAGKALNVDKIAAVAPDIESQARTLLAGGKVVAARKLLLDVPVVTSPQMAFTLARSYDPNYLATLTGPDAPPDTAEAKLWYKRWYELGKADGSVPSTVRLDLLLRSLEGGEASAP